MWSQAVLAQEAFEAGICSLRLRLCLAIFRWHCLQEKQCSQCIFLLVVDSGKACLEIL